ncbi:hypothetical protein Tco_1129224 [Tanacetum coccineum]
MSQSHSSDQLLTATQLVPVPLQIKIGKCNSKADMNNLSLVLETAANPFMPPTEFLTIKKFLKIVGYEAEMMGLDQAKIYTLQTFHVVVNKRHVDYARLICYGSCNSSKDSDELLTEDIRQTKAYKEYNKDYNALVVPMIQQSLVVSTQGMPRTLSAPRSPKPKKKKGKVVRETSEPRKSIRIKLTTKIPDSTTPYPTYSEIKYEHLTKAQQVSLVVAVSAKEAEEKENIASVEKAIMAKEEDPDTRLEPESHKESPEEKNDDDIDENDDDHHNDDALIRRKKKGNWYLEPSYDDESTRSSIPYIILTDSEAEDATLPVAPAPLSPDYVPTSPDYTPNSDSDSEPFEEDPQEADPKESYEEDPSEDDSSVEDLMEADGPF